MRTAGSVYPIDTALIKKVWVGKDVLHNASFEHVPNVILCQTILKSPLMYSTCCRMAAMSTAYVEIFTRLLHLLKTKPLRL